MMSTGEHLPIRKEGVTPLLWVFVGVFALTWIGYGRSFSYGLVWDDPIILERSREIARSGLVLQVFRLNYWERERGYGYRPYRPIRDLAFALAHRLDSEGARGFHTLSLALNGANALLVYALARRLFSEVDGAILAALLFAAYPLHVEAVAWAKNMAEPLACFLALGSILLFIRAFEKRENRWPMLLRRWVMWASSLALFAAGLLSKESVVVFPALLTVWGVIWPERKRRLAALLATVPFWALALLYAVFQFSFATGSGPQATAQDAGTLGFLGRLELAGRTVLLYVFAGFIPVPQSHWRVLPIPRESSPWLGVIIGLAAVGMGGMLLRALWRRQRVEFGWWWFLVSLAPASNFLAFNPCRPFAEQRLYFPSVGYVLLLAASYSALPRGNVLLIRRWVPPVLMGLLCVAFASLSREGTWGWRNQPALWRRIIRWSPTQEGALYNMGVMYAAMSQQAQAMEAYSKAIALTKDPRDVRPYLGLGKVLASQGRYREAAEWHALAVRRDPHNPRAHLDLAVDMAELGRLEEAVRHARHALRLRPDWALAANNLGAMLMNLGRFSEAEAYFRAALRSDPKHGLAHRNLARVLLKQGRVAEAAEAFERAGQFSENSGACYREAGRLFADLGRFDKATELLGRAVEMGIRDAMTLCWLGNAYAAQGRFEKALPFHRAAVAQNSRLAEARLRLAVDLLRLGKAATAQAELETLVRDEPQMPYAHTALGNALLAQGQKKEAEAAYETALRLDPGQPEALANLGRLYLSRVGEEAEEVRLRGISLLRKAVELAPQSAQLRVALAEALEAHGLEAEAQAEWKEALRLDPENQRARERVARSTSGDQR